MAETKIKVLKLIKEAIEFYLEGLQKEQKPIPKPLSRSEYV